MLICCRARMILLFCWKFQQNMTTTNLKEKAVLPFMMPFCWRGTCVSNSLQIYWVKNLTIQIDLLRFSRYSIFARSRLPTINLILLFCCHPLSQFCCFPTFISEYIANMGVVCFIEKGNFIVLFYVTGC